MKIALVNLCKIEDFAQTKYYQSAMDFLAENNIDYVDYMSGRATAQELLDGFHAALRDTTVDLVWFIQGGNTLITFLDNIDWELVKSSSKEYLGLSDFTHFSLHANKLGQTCYYGQGLKRIKDYLPTAADRQFLVDFLKHKTLPPIEAKLLSNQGSANLASEHIVGGHSFISAIMLPHVQLDLSNTYVFFEHHYVPGENIGDVNYFAEAVKLYLETNKPKGIILGHSLLFDENQQLIDQLLINQDLAVAFASLGVPVYSIDHFRTIVPLSLAQR
jgi:muramoyltetrapeptide carboxypeptidase LdcA involved in peptidoglycan recycling